MEVDVDVAVDAAAVSAVATPWLAAKTGWSGASRCAAGLMGRRILAAFRWRRAENSSR